MVIIRQGKCLRPLILSLDYRVDSIMLLEEGFQVTSIDFSCGMLHLAQEIRWKRRNEAAFDSWGKKN